MSQVDVGPLRDAFERSGMSTTELAARLGWVKPDSNRVTKALGITPYHLGNGHKGLRGHIGHRMATELARAMDVDPVDVGL
jgi:hypothetical protein